MLFIFEMIGTVAFAVSGALVAVKKKMDLLGVVVLGMTTAVGGGIVRDLILGITPPMAFREPVYALTSIGVSLILFLPSVRRSIPADSRLLLVMDAVGLGVFTAVGVQAGQAEGRFFLSVFVGTLTGVGGGVMRDIFAGERPAIFVRHFYACASIIGAMVCALLWSLTGKMPAMLAGSAVVTVLRILAAKYRWSLPKAEDAAESPGAETH